MPRSRAVDSQPSSTALAFLGSGIFPEALLHVCDHLLRGVERPERAPLLEILIRFREARLNGSPLRRRVLVVCIRKCRQIDGRFGREHDLPFRTDASTTPPSATPIAERNRLGNVIWPLLWILRSAVI
jgi:hypothetical protein